MTDERRKRLFCLGLGLENVEKLTPRKMFIAIAETNWVIRSIRHEVLFLYEKNGIEKVTYPVSPIMRRINNIVLFTLLRVGSRRQLILMFYTSFESSW